MHTLHRCKSVILCMQEVGDSIEQVATALEAVQQELQHCTPGVTLTLTVVLPGQGLCNSPAGSPQRPQIRPQCPSRAAAGSNTPPCQASSEHCVTTPNRAAQADGVTRSSCPESLATTGSSSAQCTCQAASDSDAPCCCTALPHSAAQEHSAEHASKHKQQCPGGVAEHQHQCPCQLEVQQSEDGSVGVQETVVAELLSDNYHDIMVETLQVWLNDLLLCCCGNEMHCTVLGWLGCDGLGVIPHCWAVLGCSGLCCACVTGA